MSLFFHDPQVLGQLGSPIGALGVETCLDQVRIVFVRNLGIGQVFFSRKGGDKGMGMGTLDRNVEELAGQDVAGAIKAACKGTPESVNRIVHHVKDVTNVGIFGSREASIRTLSSPEAKLQELDILSGRSNPVASSICGNQAGEGER